MNQGLCNFGKRAGISREGEYHWLHLMEPHVHGETFQESQVLAGQVLIRRKEAGPVISARLCDIPRVGDEGVRLPDKVRQRRRGSHTEKGSPSVLLGAQGAVSSW